MGMNVIKSDNRLCTCCMEEHEVKTIRVNEQATYKNRKVSFDALYYYCDLAEEFYMDELLLQNNDIKMKEAYRVQEGLLTAGEIIDIRTKYGITQSDLCTLLGWGGKTITRYESHQVQDKAHDMILKKLDCDPEWYLDLLIEAQTNLSPVAFQKYYTIATSLYEEGQDYYLRKAIEAIYAKYQGRNLYNGNAILSLDRVVDIIRYFASSKSVTNLYKVKLMKLMWYADALSYKIRGYAITGLVYKALPMGAVPVGHDSIIDLQNVPCEEIDMGETNAYHFSLEGVSDFPSLTKEDRDILDRVIQKLGKMSKSEVVEFMHQEQAYKETKPRDAISFQYAMNLQI